MEEKNKKKEEEKDQPQIFLLEGLGALQAPCQVGGYLF